MNHLCNHELSIIVPALREVSNIPFLAKEIYKTLEPIDFEWELIIVDDNSKDGIIEVCDGLKSRWKIPLRLIVRKKERGLATAVLEGFDRAKGSIFVVMDADRSHPPDAIPLFLMEIQRGADFVIGSRYITGGGTDDQWTLYRFLNSKFASVLARPLVSVSDPMSGFFALPRFLWERCENLSPLGYKIALEIMVKCKPQNIKEIPIQFRTRKLGKSKLTIKQQFFYLYHLRGLYAYKLRNVR